MSSQSLQEVSLELEQGFKRLADILKSKREKEGRALLFHRIFMYMKKNLILKLQNLKYHSSSIVRWAILQKSTTPIIQENALENILWF